MHDEPIPSELDDDVDLAEHSTLHLLLDEPQPAPWSVDELVLARGTRVSTLDAIAALHANGLVHMAAGFVWPTRAAVNAVRVESRV